MGYPPQGIPAAEVGGLYGINVETLGADKTLTPGTDEIYQYLDAGGAIRIITLATAGATAGDRFVIKHNGVYSDANYLNIKQAAASLEKVYARKIAGFVFDGTNWVPERIGTDTSGFEGRNVAIGYAAKAYNKGVAVGYNASGYDEGIAIGSGAAGDTKGVAIGYTANAMNYGVAVGYQAQSGGKRYSIALGYNSKCIRTGETSINISANSVWKNNVVQGRWAGETTDATPLEIFCAGYGTERFTIRASSALAFKMKIVARDNVDNHVAMYTVEDGLIRMAGAGTAVMAICNVTVIFEDDVAWDVAVAIDVGGNNLIITVTGDDTNPTQWAAVMDGGRNTLLGYKTTC